jgi:hypothetical protein
MVLSYNYAKQKRRRRRKNAPPSCRPPCSLIPLDAMHIYCQPDNPCTEASSYPPPLTPTNNDGLILLPGLSPPPPQTPRPPPSPQSLSPQRAPSPARVMGAKIWSRMWGSLVSALVQKLLSLVSHFSLGRGSPPRIKI